MLIREAVKNDIDSIMELEASAHTVDAFDKEGLSIALRGNPFLVLVAIEDNNLVAFNISEITNVGLHLVDIVVRKDHRSNGIAAELTHASVTIALCGGNVHRIWAEVRESNLPSRRSLENEGFTVEGKADHYYSSPLEDAIIYALYC